MFYFLDPSLRDVLEAVGGGDGEAEKQHVGVGVGERAQPVIILISVKCTEHFDISQVYRTF